MLTGHLNTGFDERTISCNAQSGNRPGYALVVAACLFSWVCVKLPCRRFGHGLGPQAPSSAHGVASWYPPNIGANPCSRSFGEAQGSPLPQHIEEIRLLNSLGLKGGAIGRKTGEGHDEVRNTAVLRRIPHLSKMS